MDTQLTERQQAVYNLVSTRIQAGGLPPTRAEIAREMGFRSANAAEEHLRALARKGVLILSPKARGISLTVSSRGLPRSTVIELIQNWRKKALLESRSDYLSCADELEHLISE